uniref:Uncharacterized protein n=1 Tax=Myotis myotis TaxID=51298 RepID=A0A7J7WI78_MYOMY|nr:hypothetical protein mMyoMyo1_012121 [Myotis myotis]
MHCWHLILIVHILSNLMKEKHANWPHLCYAPSHAHQPIRVTICKLTKPRWQPAAKELVQAGGLVAPAMEEAKLLACPGWLWPPLKVTKFQLWKINKSQIPASSQPPWGAWVAGGCGQPANSHQPLTQADQAPQRGTPP